MTLDIAENQCEKNTHKRQVYIASRYSSTSDESHYFSRILRKGLIVIKSLHIVAFYVQLKP